MNDGMMSGTRDKMMSGMKDKMISVIRIVLRRG